MKIINQTQIEKEVGNNCCPVCENKRIKLVKQFNNIKFYACNSCGTKWEDKMICAKIFHKKYKRGFF